MPEAWDHLEEDVRRETEMTDDFLLFFFVLVAVVTPNANPSQPYPAPS